MDDDDDAGIRWWAERGMEEFINLTENVNGNEENRAGTIAGAIPSTPDQQATKAN